MIAVSDARFPVLLKMEKCAGHRDLQFLACFAKRGVTFVGPDEVNNNSDALDASRGCNCRKEVRDLWLGGSDAYAAVLKSKCGVAAATSSG